MIPKIIHYCWFGGKPIPDDLQKCIDTWKKVLPNYEIKRWDESNCSFDENEFVRKTYAEGKLGFIGDYYRLKAVYEYGGIYLDTDVKVYRSFDDFLNYPCFFNFNYNCTVGTAVFGAEKGNPFLKELLDTYDKTVFEENKSEWNLAWEQGKLKANCLETSNYYWTWHLIRNYSEFKLNNKMQKFENFIVFPKEYFEIGMLSGKHYAIHLNAGAWRIHNENPNSIYGKLKKALAKNEKLYDFIQILIRRRRYRKANKRLPFYQYSIDF